MPLRTPFTAKPFSKMCGGAACSGPVIAGVGNGAGAAAAAGVLLAGVELGADCESEEVVCPKDGYAATATNKAARKLSDVMRKVNLLFKSLLLIQLGSSIAWSSSRNSSSLPTMRCD